MKRTQLCAAVVLATVALVALTSSACGPRQEAGADGESGRSQPNVLIVLIDALRSDHLGVYGYPLPTSPEIDAFSAEATVFERAFSHSTWTKPSLATLFTSVYPDQHGLGRVGFEDAAGFQTDVLPGALETLAERFSEAGYRTGSIGTNVHIQKKTGFAQGFDHFFHERMVTAFEVNELLKEWLDSSDQSTPFFAYAHYMDVHFPYKQSLPGEKGRFGNIRTRPPAPTHWTRVDEWAAKHLNAENLAALVARYDTEIAYVDAAFGELVDWLRRAGRLEDTVVLLIADHGEGFNEHGELQHGFAPYVEVTSIPFVLRLPSADAVEGGRQGSVVGIVDVLPTLLDLAGIEPPAAAEGRSLMPLLEGEALRERPVYIEGAGARGLRSSTHTLLARSEGASECFDLRVDPAEESPLAEPWPNECLRLAAGVETLVGQFHLLTEGDEATVTLEESEVEALRALGYLD